MPKHAWVTSMRPISSIEQDATLPTMLSSAAARLAVSVATQNIAGGSLGVAPMPALASSWRCVVAISEPTLITKVRMPAVNADWIAATDSRRPPAVSIVSSQVFGSPSVARTKMVGSSGTVTISESDARVAAIASPVGVAPPGVRVV